MSPLLPIDVQHPALELVLQTQSFPSRPKFTFIPNLMGCRHADIFNSILEVGLGPADSPDINISFRVFCDSLKDIILQHTPLKKIGSTRFPCWFTTELINLIIQKKRLHRIYKNTFTRISYLEFSRVREDCRRLSRRCYSDYLDYVQNCLPSNPKVFWSFINNLRRREVIPTKLVHNDLSSTQPEQMCELFADFFSSVFSPPSYPTTHYSFNTVNCLSKLSFTEKEVFDVLGELDVTKGCGPDLIPSSVLKYCRVLLCYPLQALFNRSLREGIFPDVLKLGYVVPIHKAGSKEDVTNYRPVVMQSAVAKVFEKLVVRNLNPLFRGILSPRQHGFTSGRSTSTNLVVMETEIIEAFSARQQLDAIYLDFSKAFDRVSHHHLLAKLKAYGIIGELLNWFDTYLSNRKLSVRFFGHSSSEFQATSGVPQGSHLGPCLFNAFVNDIVEVIGADCLLFADDIKIYGKIASRADSLMLQESLHAIENWCQTNCMSLNVNKCNCITFHKTKSPIIFDYKLYNVPLKRCENIRDLGVILAQDMRSNVHIQNICASASRSLGLLARTSRDFNSLQPLRTLYCALVRPLLEYNCVVWSPHQRTLARELQAIQDRFLRLLGCRMGFAFNEVPVRSLELLFDLQSLEVRRNVIGVMFLHKLVNGVVDCPELLGRIGLRCRSGTRSTELFERRHVSSNYEDNSTLIRLQQLGNKVSRYIDFFADSPAVVRRKLKSVASDELLL